MPESTRALAAPAAVLGLCACLLLYGLGQPKLWIDEAETALLGRSILEHGIPEARVGKNLISQEIGKEFGPDLVWRWTPWLDKYVAAGSFALFGESTVSARLPFALLGVVTVASVYSLAFGLFGDPRIALLAMAFLGTSVPFLLQARQCRYYVLAILGSLWAVHFAVATVRRGGWRAPLGLAAALTLVFHANYLTFAALATALAGSVWVLGVERAAFGRLVVAGLVTAAVNGPWLVILNVADKTSRVASFNAGFLPDYAGLIVRYGFPVAALGVFAVLAAVTRSGRALLAEWRVPTFLALLPFFYIPVICFGPLRFFRYTANLLPVFAVLLAWLSVRAWDMHRVAGAVLTLLLLVTGVFAELSALPTRYGGDFLPGRTSRTFDWVFPLGNFLAELAAPYETCMGQVVNFLAANAHRGDRFFTTYGDLEVRFYLPDLEVRGGQSGESLDGWGFPEWILLRRFFRFIGREPGSDAQSIQDWIDHSVPWAQYQRIELAVPDLPWEAISEPQWHWFFAPASGPGVVIGQRMRGGDSSR